MCVCCVHVCACYNERAVRCCLPEVEAKWVVHCTCHVLIFKKRHSYSYVSTCRKQGGTAQWEGEHRVYHDLMARLLHATRSVLSSLVCEYITLLQPRAYVFSVILHPKKGSGVVGPSVSAAALNHGHIMSFLVETAVNKPLPLSLVYQKYDYYMYINYGNDTHKRIKITY